MDDRPMLTALAEGVWLDQGPVSIVGMRLTATMTVLALGDGGLLLHSPLPLTPERREQVEALGRVSHLYAPNTFHHLWLGDWSQAFPAAQVHAPSALAKKRPELRIDRFHDEASELALGGAIVEVPIRGFRLAETALVHRASKTAVVTDLVHNIGRPADAWTKFYSKAMGFYDRVALSRAIRWTGFDDRGAARRSVDELLSQEFENLVVGHGAPILSLGREALTTGASWLPAASAPGLVVRSKRSPLFSPKPCG